MLALERELDSLHTLNSKDDNFRGSHRIENGVFRKSTIMTADMGTERRDEVINLDSLKSHILVQRSKLHHTLDRLQEVQMEKLTLQEMLKKTRD